MKGTQTKVGAASFQGEDVRCEVPRLSGAGSRPPDKLLFSAGPIMYAHYKYSSW